MSRSRHLLVPCGVGLGWGTRRRWEGGRGHLPTTPGLEAAGPLLTAISSASHGLPLLSEAGAKFSQMSLEFSHAWAPWPASGWGAVLRAPFPGPKVSAHSGSPSCYVLGVLASPPGLHWVPWAGFVPVGRGSRSRPATSRGASWVPEAGGPEPLLPSHCHQCPARLF